jgi:hypothetical protein
LQVEFPASDEPSDIQNCCYNKKDIGSFGYGSAAFEKRSIPNKEKRVGTKIAGIPIRKLGMTMKPGRTSSSQKGT